MNLVICKLGNEHYIIFGIEPFYCIITVLNIHLQISEAGLVNFVFTKWLRPTLAGKNDAIALDLSSFDLQDQSSAPQGMTAAETATTIVGSEKPPTNAAGDRGEGQEENA